MTPDPRGAAAPGRSAAATRLRIGLIVAAYVALTVWWLWPLPAHLADHATYPHSAMAEIAADYDLITWALAWDTHALLTNPAGLFDANIFYPARHALAFSEHFLGYVPFFAPTYLLTGNAVLASNVLLFLTFPLCAIAMFALARRFVTPEAAFVAGALFAFTGQRYQNLYHIHQLGTFYLPLALLFTERWLERARRRDAFGLAAAIGLQLLSSYYLAYAMVLMYATYLPLALWHWRGALDRRRCAGLIVAWAAAALPFLLASMPYLELQNLGLVPSIREGARALTLEPWMTRDRVQAYLTSGASGPVAYLLALSALLAGWRRGRYARVIGLVALVTGLLLAFGPRVLLFGTTWWSPYQLLFRWLPGFAAIRLPSRLLVMAQVGLSLLAALGLDQIRRTLPPRLTWPVTLAILVLALSVGPQRMPHTLQPQQTGARLPSVYRWLADHGGGGVLLELPLAGAASAGRRMLMSTNHWLPMIDGYSAYPPLTRAFLRRIADGLPDEAAVQELIDFVDVKWIVVHLDEYGPRGRSLWTSATLHALKLTGSWGDDLLFAVMQPIADDRRALLRRTDRTLGGLAQAAVATPCRGRLRAQALGEDRAFATGEQLSVGVEIENASTSAWPGAGLYPRHLVQLRTSFARDGAAFGRATTTPLWVDVPAGGSVSAVAAVTAPPIPGSYELAVELVQDGSSLEDCGLSPARLSIRVAGNRASIKRSR